MKDPERLSVHGASPLRQMLRATQRVGASEQARSRLLRRLGWLTAVSVVSSYAAAAAAALASAKGIATVTILAVASGLGALAWEELAPSASPSQPLYSVMTPPAEGPTHRPVAVAEPELVATSPDDLPPASPQGLNKPPLSGADLLGAEIQLIDGARSSIRRGQSQAGLDRLTQYRKQFPGGRFSLEADALQIEALATSGQRARAETLARRFLAQHPKSLLAARVRPYAGSTAD